VGNVFAHATSYCIEYLQVQVFVTGEETIS
jgi:hypothetical protein